MSQNISIPKIITIIPKENYHLYVEYDDGVKGDVDLSHLKGRGVFEWWNKNENFLKAKIEQNGSIVWNENIDIDALSCYLKITNQSFEEYANC